MADRSAGWRALTLAVLASTALAACSQAPAYHPPIVTAPAAYKEAGPWQPASPASPAISGAWWTVYGDQTLDGLETKIGSDNPTLQAALGRYQEAQADLKEAHSAALPHIGLGADPMYDRQSDNRPLRGSTQPDTYSDDALGGAVSYEVDLWGRVSNSVAAGRADAQASADDLAAIRLSLEAELAHTYVELRGDDRQIELLRETVDDYSRADAMTRRRFADGIASGIETGQSGTQLQEARAQLADLNNSRALLEHAIASLIGTPASSFSLAASTQMPTIPDTPVGVPSTLLERRPDVAAAERRMFAANRRIGVAKAAFFPQLMLGGEGGLENTGIAGLLSASNIFWSLGPRAVLSVFDGGKRHAKVEEARAQWTQATADYRTCVLDAFQQVEDSLSRLHHLGDETRAETAAQQQAGQTEQLSLNRYRKGAEDYLTVVTTQTTALRVRRAVIALDTRRVEASIDLIRALGGGWTPAA
ncbi:efflux transporter outer membrane subunit [Novosphingobium sp. 9]|uniref:efflux transporter outer membrane subunit n=1 Tax=Novosphingobium sp. 9 TaxID=2025349 RepID=UPI0021B56EBA|nr:efflux transporter outer membrane subunit [Novosphingobium sp. 9]